MVVPLKSDNSPRKFRWRLSVLWGLYGFWIVYLFTSFLIFAAFGGGNEISFNFLYYFIPSPFWLATGLYGLIGFGALFLPGLLLEFISYKSGKDVSGWIRFPQLLNMRKDLRIVLKLLKFVIFSYILLFIFTFILNNFDII